MERILRGIWSVFINPGENVSVRLNYYRAILTDVLRKALTDCENIYIGCNSIYSAFTGDLATVKESCVLYPTELVTLQKSSDFRLSFELTDGMLVFNGRYFRSLRNITPNERDRARKSLVYKAKKIVPSNIEEHSRLTLTIREAPYTWARSHGTRASTFNSNQSTVNPLCVHRINAFQTLQARDWRRATTRICIGGVYNFHFWTSPHWQETGDCSSKVESDCTTLVLRAWGQMYSSVRMLFDMCFRRRIEPASYRYHFLDPILCIELENTLKQNYFPSIVEILEEAS